MGPGRGQPRRVHGTRARARSTASTYATCTTNANLDVRRVLYQENPSEAQYLGSIDEHSDVGTQDYRALKLSARRRAAAA